MDGPEIRAAEMESRRLNRILVRYHDHVPVWVLGVEPPSNAGHPLGEFFQSLCREVHAQWVVPITLDLVREHVLDIGPAVPLPSLFDRPLRKRAFDSHRHSRSCCYLLGGPKGSLQWRRPNGHNRPGGKVPADPAGLVSTMWGKPEAGQRCDHHGVGVVHFGVTDQVYQGSHDDSLAGESVNPG